MQLCWLLLIPSTAAFHPRVLASFCNTSGTDCSSRLQGAAEAKEGKEPQDEADVVKARTDSDKSEAISEASTSKVHSRLTGPACLLLGSLVAPWH